MREETGSLRWLIPLNDVGFRDGDLVWGVVDVDMVVGVVRDETGFKEWCEGGEDEASYGQE